MLKPHTICAGILSALVAVSPALTWTAPTRMRMVDDAVKLMPRSLRALLQAHRKSVLRGALEPLTEEGKAGHLPADLPEQAAELSDRLVAAIDGHQPVGRIAERFGRLAHTVADAGYPPLAAGKAGAGHYRHFGDFVENRLDKFPLVFYGHQDPDATAFRPADRIRSILRRCREDDTRLETVYAQAGNPPDPAFFDDRSIPFAVGSLSYSRSVTDIVRFWLNAWSRAHGDMGRTPYLRRPAGASNRSPN